MTLPNSDHNEEHRHERDHDHAEKPHRVDLRPSPNSQLLVVTKRRFALGMKIRHPEPGVRGQADWCRRRGQCDHGPVRVL